MTALAALMLLSCSATWAQDSPSESLTIVADRTTLRFGEPFTLVVIRTWTMDRPMEPLTSAMLKPLDVRLLSSETTVQGDQVRDTRIYRAYLFRTGRVVLPKVVLRVREDASGVMGEVASAPTSFEVSSILDAADPSTPEGPSRDRLLRWAAPAPRVAWILWVGLALIGAFLRGLWRAARDGVGSQDTSAISPRERMDGLIASLPRRGGAERLDVVGEVIACLKRETARRTGTDVDSMTNAELARDARIRGGLGPETLARLLSLLRRGGDWRYGGSVPDSEDVRQFAVAARTWLDRGGESESVS